MGISPISDTPPIGSRIIFLTGTLNFAYADEGPGIGPNQAEKIAQDYLNSNNLSYTAMTPSDDDQQIKVKDTQTGEVKWIPMTLANKDIPDSNGKMRYEWIEGDPIWIVQINDNSGQNVGQIYVDDRINQVLKVVIQGKVLKDDLNQREQLTEDYYNSLETNDTYEPSITENISGTYESLSEFSYMLYPLTQISQILSLNNPEIGIITPIVIIAFISWI